MARTEAIEVPIVANRSESGRSGALEEPVDLPSQGSDERFVHLAITTQYPVALCGFVCSQRVIRAPGRDRCPACLKIARDRGLKVLGWKGGPARPAASP